MKEFSFGVSRESISLCSANSEVFSNFVRKILFDKYQNSAYPAPFTSFVGNRIKSVRKRFELLCSAVFEHHVSDPEWGIGNGMRRMQGMGGNVGKMGGNAGNLGGNAGMRGIGF